LKSFDRTASESKRRTVSSAIFSETVFLFGQTEAPREWAVEQP